MSSSYSFILFASICKSFILSFAFHCSSHEIPLVAGLGNNHIVSSIRLRGGGGSSVSVYKSKESIIIPPIKQLGLPVLSHRNLQSSNENDGRIRFDTDSFSESLPNGLLSIAIEKKQELGYQQLNNSLIHEKSLVNIPEHFRENDLPYILSYQSDPRRKSFPRWGDNDSKAGVAGDTEESTMEDSNIEEESTMLTMIDFIDESAKAYGKFFAYHEEGDKMNAHVVHTKDHILDVCAWLPEVLYILHGTSELTNHNNENEKKDGAGHGLYVSDTAFNTTATYFATMLYKKLTSTHDLVVRAYNTFRRLVSSESSQMTNATSLNPNDIIDRWPRLYQILHVEQRSIPFIMWHGDYTGCNYHNWPSKKASIPLFTVAANVECHYTIPFPNYQTFDDSHETAKEWIDDFITNKLEWKDKIPKAVWRGGLTGRMPVTTNEADRGPRYHLLKHVHTIATQEQREMFDVKLNYLTRKPEFDILLMPKNTGSDNSSSVETNGAITKTEFLGEVGGPWIPMERYNDYQAIIDVDGHSWSSRFGKLLCYNSVILKIEPKYVDYFYYKRPIEKHVGEDSDSMNNDDVPILMPWKHYIPIRYDMSDLFEKTQYALDTSNAEHISTIISNANAWCHKNMIRDSLTYDVLDIWEAYTQNVLDMSTTKTDNGSSVTWQEQWQEYMPTVMNGPLNMQQIEHYE